MKQWSKIHVNVTSSISDPREKLKHVLWLGDLKASLSSPSKKLIHITPCIFQMFFQTQNYPIFIPTLGKSNHY